MKYTKEQTLFIKDSYHPKGKTMPNVKIKEGFFIIESKINKK